MLDGPGNLGQQPAAGQVPVEVVDALEVVQVNEDQAEGETEAAGALKLDLGDGKQVPRVEEAGAVIGDGQFLNALHGAHILNGDRRVVAQHLEKGHGFPGQGGHAIVKQLDHAQGTIPAAQRYADCGSYRGKGRRVTVYGETGIVAG